MKRRFDRAVRLARHAAALTGSLARSPDSPSGWVFAAQARWEQICGPWFAELCDCLGVAGPGLLSERMGDEMYCCRLGLDDFVRHLAADSAARGRRKALHRLADALARFDRRVTAAAALRYEMIATKPPW